MKQETGGSPLVCFPLGVSHPLWAKALPQVPQQLCKCHRPPRSQREGHTKRTFGTGKGADHSLGTLPHKPRRWPSPLSRGFGVQQKLIPSPLSRSFLYPEAIHPVVRPQAGMFTQESSFPHPHTQSSASPVHSNPSSHREPVPPTKCLPGCLALPWTVYFKWDSLCTMDAFLIWRFHKISNLCLNCTFVHRVSARHWRLKAL